MKRTDSSLKPTRVPCRLVRQATLPATMLCALLLAVSPASAKEVQRLPHEPSNPKIHTVYFNTTDNKEYIYNGQEWVPHDASIDSYVLKKYKKPNPKPSKLKADTDKK
ncbi:hypothetical protein GMST_28440 [Geomonas silvestris]|uniref:Lipoprotein n=1 Tax=Geomonas silvestris TaxID=2740184 RepID=A0A6V8MLK8_9BACT|nr:hypothetical protein [Geomonas silvestris]GFO60519.1 hypothetical protein GMST_28440 [Geomonas silvestris]